MLLQVAGVGKSFVVGLALSLLRPLPDPYRFVLLRALKYYHAVTHEEWPLNPLQPNISMNILHTVP